MLNDRLQLCFVPDSESTGRFQVDPITNRSDPPNEHQRIPAKALSHPDSRSTAVLHDPAMGNALIRFVLPGTQRTDEAKAPPVVRRDVNFTHSVLDEGRGGRAHSVASEVEGEG